MLGNFKYYSHLFVWDCELYMKENTLYLPNLGALANRIAPKALVTLKKTTKGDPWKL